MTGNKFRRMKQKSHADFRNCVKSLNRKPSNSDMKLEIVFDFFKYINGKESNDVDVFGKIWEFQT